MENKVARIKIIFLLSAVSCLALAMLFRSGWWAMSGVGIGLMLWVLYQRDDAHTLCSRSIFFALAPLITIPALLQAGAGFFAFIAAGLLWFAGELLRKLAKRDLAAVEGGTE